eukprot:1192603-Prorocentrum_minimum.AAC.1
MSHKHQKHRVIRQALALVHRCWQLHLVHQHLSTQAAERVHVTTAKRVYSLSPSVIGARYGYILSPLLRLVPATGIFSLPFCVVSRSSSLGEMTGSLSGGVAEISAYPYNLPSVCAHTLKEEYT